MMPKSDKEKTGNDRGSSGQFKKGGKGGPGRKPGAKVRIKRCADFMENKGWKLLEDWAKQKGNPKVAVDALKTIAAYGYGRPTELIEFSGEGEARSIADFFNTKSKNRKVKSK